MVRSSLQIWAEFRQNFHPIEGSNPAPIWNIILFSPRKIWYKLKLEVYRQSKKLELFFQWNTCKKYVLCSFGLFCYFQTLENVRKLYQTFPILPQASTIDDILKLDPFKNV